MISEKDQVDKSIEQLKIDQKEIDGLQIAEKKQQLYLVYKMNNENQTLLAKHD